MIFLQKYNDYYLARKFATGGMAEIFRAWKVGEAGFEKQVVIKRMLTHLTTNEDFLSMFLSEAKLVSRLNHANITQVYDLGKNQDRSESLPTYFIAMEFVFGKNLAQIIKRAREQSQPLSWECMAAICLGAAQALEYAHALSDEHGRPLNIVHRDISPQNILISYSGEVKLVDFGIAKALVGQQQTQTGVLKGKLSYMSPEQAMGEPVDLRSDIYSLGIVLWEMLTGNRLFTGDSEVGILQKVIKPEVPDPATIDPNIPRELAQACMNCLHSDRDQRYGNALALIKDLNGYLQQLPNFSGNLALREHMHLLFRKEMISEKEQIQEELQSVRQALTSSDMDSSATVVITSDGNLSIAPDQVPTAVMDSGHALDTASKTSVTFSGKIMRLANSMRAMTKRAVVLTAATIVLLIALVAVVAMWPEGLDKGLQHSAPTVAAPPPLAHDHPASVATEMPVDSQAPPSQDAPREAPAKHAASEHGHSQELPAEIQGLTPDKPKQVAAVDQSAPPSGPSAAAKDETKSQPGQPKAVDTPKPTAQQDPAGYDPRADPALKSTPRDFDQSRFDRLQSEFQQEQFAALDNKRTSGALEGRTIPGEQRVKVAQADVTIRVWRQFGAAMDIEVLVNGRPASAQTAGFSVGRQPVDIPVRLRSGQNSIRLTHAGESIVEGFQVQVGSSPAYSLTLGSKDADSLIVEY